MTSKVDPEPTALDTVMSPPQARTKFSERKSPSPVPPFRMLQNGSKICFRCSGGIPQPLSLTRMRTGSPPLDPDA